MSSECHFLHNSRRRQVGISQDPGKLSMSFPSLLMTKILQNNTALSTQGAEVSVQ